MTSSTGRWNSFYSQMVSFVIFVVKKGLTHHEAHEDREEWKW